MKDQAEDPTMSRKAQKREERRRALAESTAEALGELGFANTTMRDIAARSGDSLSTLHYYFEDRVDLISYSVRYHKMAFLAELSDAVAAETMDELIELFSAGLAKGVTYNADNHKNWFDIRNQATFDKAFAPVIEDIEGTIIQIFADIENRFLPGRADALLDYTAIDGLFRYIMQSELPEHRDYQTNFSLFERMLRYLWQG